MSVYKYINNPHYRILLFPLALFYWGVMFWRNLFYNIGVFVSRNLPCKVISIGNITHFIYNKLKSLKIVSHNSKIVPSESLIGTNGNKISVNAMKNERTIAVSGIGDPKGFELLLEKLRLNIVDHIFFDDHHEIIKAASTPWDSLAHPG